MMRLGGGRSRESDYVPSRVIHKTQHNTHNYYMKSIRPFVPLITMIIIFLSLSACKSSKTSCDAYGELKKQHDAYHREPVQKNVAR
jgi:hypothetical protein